MALGTERRIVLGAILVLLLGVGTYELWVCMALRDHPWQLESHANRLAAECRTAPGAFVFRDELRGLTAQLDDAKLCLIYANEDWVFRRDFTPCVQKLLNASLTALRIRMSESARHAEEETRLAVTLKVLELQFDGNTREGETGAKYGIRNYSQSQARTQFEAARNLARLGQTESALTAALRARGAWAQSEDFVAAELARFYDNRLRARWENEAQSLLHWTLQTGRSAILVDKLEHRCLLLSDGRIAKSYVANLGRNWYRIKVQEHDASTPEGEYKIRRKFRSGSFGWALLLDYPNAADMRRFNSLKRAGDIAARARVGGSIEIHGGGRLNSDWTDGCVSLENPDMAELFKRAYVGMPVTIVGASRLAGSAKD